MKAPAKLVTKSVGSRTRRATPTQRAVKRMAPRRPMTRAATRAKMKTPMVKTMKRARGMPLMAIWERRKAWDWVVRRDGLEGSLLGGVETWAVGGIVDVDLRRTWASR